MTKLPIPFGNPMTYAGHSGVDFPQPAGTPFRASGSGVVTWLGSNSRGGYFIWVKYDAIGPKVGYHHMPSHAACPREGARFSVGDQLGVVGNTGNSTGPHLHSEVEGYATTAGYWQFFDRNRVVGSSGKLAVDGEWGAATTRALQSALDVTADGEMGPITVRALQSRLAAVGHLIEVDGEIGPATIRAMQTFILGHEYADGQMGPRTIRGLQSYLNSGGKFTIPGRLTVDGDWGPATTKAMQKALGVTQDGEIGPATTRALQSKLGIPADGEWGPQTTRALQTWLGVTADGEIGTATTRALQTALNAGKVFTKVTLPAEPDPAPAATPRTPVYPGAIRGWDVPLASARPKNASIDWFIIHHQGSTNDDEAYFKRANERGSCPTWQVKTNGNVVEFIPPQMRPSSSGEANGRSVAVETQNTTMAPDWGISAESHEAIAQLVAWTFQQKTIGGVPVNLKLDRDHIFGDREITAKTGLPMRATLCPGPSMDMDRIVARAKQIVSQAGPTPKPDSVPVERSTLQSWFDKLKQLLGG